MDFIIQNALNAEQAYDIEAGLVGQANIKDNPWERGQHIAARHLWNESFPASPECLAMRGLRN